MNFKILVCLSLAVAATYANETFLMERYLADSYVTGFNGTFVNISSSTCTPPTATGVDPCNTISSGSCCANWYKNGVKATYSSCVPVGLHYANVTVKTDKFHFVCAQPARYDT